MAKERADVILSWTFAPTPEAVRASFTRPTRFVAIPTPPNRGYRAQVNELGPYPVRAALRKYLPNVSPTRVAVLGFSESCHGVRELLQSADADNIDSVIAIDGIHTPFQAWGPPKQVDMHVMLPWLLFGAKATINIRQLVVTHSSVVPPTFTSTTQTANWLWDKLTTSEPAFTAPPVPDIVVPPTTINVNSVPNVAPYTVDYPTPPWQPFKRLNGLTILGCNNLDPAGYADHIYQAKAILPAAIEALLVPRWTEVDPDAPDQACFLGEVKPSCAQTNILPEGWEDEEVPLPESVKKHTGTAVWGDVALGAGLGLGGALMYRLWRSRRG